MWKLTQRANNGLPCFAQRSHTPAVYMQASHKSLHSGATPPFPSTAPEKLTCSTECKKALGIDKLAEQPDEEKL